MAEKYQVNIEVKSNLDQTNKDVKTLNTNMASTKTEAAKLGTTLDQIGGGGAKDKISGLLQSIGGLNPAFKSASEGANGMILKMWEMVANPIGAVIAAIVIGVKFLYEAFQHTTAGSKELKQVWAGVSEIGSELKSAIFGLGMALIDTYKAMYRFATFDFKGGMAALNDAAKEAKGSIEQVGEALDGTTMRNVMNIEKQQQANDKARRRQEANEARANYLLLKSREILTDENSTIEQKKVALEEVSKVEIATAKERERIAAVDLKLQKMRRDLKREGTVDYAEENKKVIELRSAYFDAAAQSQQNEIKLNKQRKMLRRQESAEIKQDEADKAAATKATQDAEKEAITKRFELEKLSFEERRKIVNQDKNLSEKDRKDFLDKINSEERKATEDHNKAIADLNKKYDDEKLNRLADTAVKKEELDYTRRLAEINSIAQTEQEKQTLIEKLDAEHKERMGIARKTDADKKESDDKNSADKEIAQAKRVADAKKAIQDSTFSVIEGGIGLLKGLFEKNKAIQKGLLIAESATGIARIITNTQATNSADGFTAAAMGPVAGPPYLATKLALNNTSAGIGIAANLLATAKALSALGGGGGAGGGSNPTNSAGGGGPKFNVVGASGVNQLAGAMANRQQAPIETYVVANNVSTAMALDRNIIRSATLG